MKKFASLAVLLLSVTVMAAPNVSNEYEVGSISIIETTKGLKGMKAYQLDAEGDEPATEKPPVDRIEQAGKVISVAKDLVALGETIYDLVKKGKPSNTTTYAAISVVPKDPTTKEIVSPFDLEGFSMPVERSFTAKVLNMNGKEVVRFDYQLVYSFGGSYDGKGKYLTGVMIVPRNITTSFGWDFNATMKLDAIMNHGSKDDPIAGALVTIKYQMNSWSKSFERNDAIHVTGSGEVKSFGIK
ncbi:MAG TPA: hypothetical protein VNJ08_12595 [Bacteriovoracaceae bacterium]|nr:hypothetical protein [Bacteriovoracaceae bacterium]